RRLLRAASPTLVPYTTLFRSNDALDGVVIGVGGRVGPGKDQLVVEDIEALVLHRAEIEIADGDDVEHIQIIFTAEAAFVPGHGRSEEHTSELQSRENLVCRLL